MPGSDKLIRWGSALSRDEELEAAIEEAIADVKAGMEAGADFAPDLALVHASSVHGDDFESVVPLLRQKLPSLRTIFGSSVSVGLLLLRSTDNLRSCNVLCFSTGEGAAFDPARACTGRLCNLAMHQTQGFGVVGGSENGPVEVEGEPAFSITLGQLPGVSLSLHTRLAGMHAIPRIVQQAYLMCAPP
jgi:small ligand-binding sensory domain FIST